MSIVRTSKKTEETKNGLSVFFGFFDVDIDAIRGTDTISHLYVRLIMLTYLTRNRLVHY